MIYISTMNDVVYPAQYESRLMLKNGKEVFLRPVRQTDKPQLVDLLNKLSPGAVYLRFLRPVADLPEELLHQLTHINYTTNFALVALIEENGQDAIIASARYGYDPDNHVTDLAIVVRDDWQHLGLGKFLLTKILDIGRKNGISRFVSVMDSTNQAMRHILQELGYKVNHTYRGGAIQVEVVV